MQVSSSIASAFEKTPRHRNMHKILNCKIFNFGSALCRPNATPPAPWSLSCGDFGQRLAAMGLFHIK